MIKKSKLINLKFSSFQRNSKKFSGINYNTNILQQNTFFLWSVENFFVKSKHIEMLTWYSKWKLKKKGWIIFPLSCDFPLTKKPTEVWMGKGKGAIYDWATPIKKGSNFLFVKSTNMDFNKTLLKDLKKKLPIKSKISVFKHNLIELNKKSIDQLNNRFLLKLH